MLARPAYYTLLSSLPALPPRFDVERCPITRSRLEQRLQMLSPDDAMVLNRLLDFLAWDRQPLEQSDQDVITNYQALIDTIRHPLLREFIDDHMDRRTILSALRRRRQGGGAPPGVGRLAEPIRRRWNQPLFGLETRFPWIAEADRLLAVGAARELEKLILAISWTRWSREASHRHFSFEAVLLYVARWAIVHRWTSQNAIAGRERFESLLETLLEDHVHFDN
ncbi:DUF2764 family protein [Candidatus Laterigemmans baculatus]|uniref:DUF2764 family protein n=1 Tax=Candidatus Laterigemmans baculatus TaxID=2770505 RepID=UPI0013DAE6FB|nr:DUF2764 family protein [Candidatus Laterigemmans baculatus]